MAAVWRIFQNPPFEALVFYLGSHKNFALETGRASGVVLWPYDHNTTANLLANLFAKIGGNRTKNNVDRDAPPDSGLTLKDYRWPSAERQFRDLLRQFHPQTVVLEYVTMAYLAKVTRATIPNARIVLDSHDILHRRCAQFTSAGYRHWLQIGEQEEIDAVRQCDVILAIQDDEAQWFRKVAPDAQVLTVGHSFNFGQIKPTWREAPKRDLVVGYFGSNNGSNIDAITTFVKTAWPEILKSRPAAELLIGGTIADAESVRQCATATRVCLRRNFASPDEFYRAVDLVINPVRFGTGLKIKTVEALAHGRPVVTTSSGRIGVPDSLKPACVAVDQVEQMAQPIVTLLSNPNALLTLSQAAYELANNEFSEERVLSQFRRSLLVESEPASHKSTSLA